LKMFTEMKTVLPINQIKIIILCLFLFSKGIAQQNITVADRYRKTGPVYFVNTGDKHAMLSVYSLQDTGKYSCILRLNDLQNAQLLLQKEITSSNPITSEQVIGKIGNTLWVFIDSLVGYDTQTLEPVATETAIAEKNPFMLNNFSRYANGYLLDEAAQVLYITAANDQRYKLYPTDFLMKPDDTVSDPAIEDDFNYEFAAEYKVNNRYELKYALANVDTFNQHLYILGSDKETAQVLSYFGSAIYPEREEMRKLTIIAYNKDGEKIDYDQHKPFTSAKQYFKAGFLQRKFFTTAWHSINGERIILYEKDKRLSIVLTDSNGKEKWNIDTKQFFNNFTDYLINDQYLVTWFEGKGGSLFITIDLSTGAFKQS